MFVRRALSNWDDDNQFKDSQVELSDKINDDNQFLMDEEFIMDEAAPNAE